MGIDISANVYAPNFDFWSREITITPVASQPGGAAYSARGIYDTRGTMVQTEQGLAILSDQETILDIREREFPVKPVQGDMIDIPPDGTVTEGVGLYEVTDSSDNGGGETTLVLRKIVPTVNPFGEP